MRTVLLLATSILVLSLAGVAAAQDIDRSTDGDENIAARESSPRTPAMIVHEVIQPQPMSIVSPATGARGKSRIKTPSSGVRVEAAQSPEPKAPPALVVSSVQPLDQGRTNDIGSTGNPKYDELIMQSSARYGVDPNLIISLMRQESGFNPQARSYKGAQGLMQLMPATAHRFGVANPYDPAQNIDAGTRYLRFLLDTFDGDIELTLAGYNAGEGAVINSGYKIPRYRETQNYVKTITARYGATKHRMKATVRNANPVAPTAITFSGGVSTRLSNNY
jgi:soluble lytic murein transglycosylase-like protein